MFCNYTNGIYEDTQLSWDCFRCLTYLIFWLDPYQVPIQSQASIDSVAQCLLLCFLQDPKFWRACVAIIIKWLINKFCQTLLFLLSVSSWYSWMPSPTFPALSCVLRLRFPACLCINKQEQIKQETWSWKILTFLASSTVSLVCFVFFTPLQMNTFFWIKMLIIFFQIFTLLTFYPTPWLSCWGRSTACSCQTLSGAWNSS